ncbi:Hypothetical protein ABZS17D1_00565 [Kosakonia cowanii]
MSELEILTRHEAAQKTTTIALIFCFERDMSDVKNLNGIHLKSYFALFSI